MQVIELTALSYSALCAGIDCSQYRPHFCNATAPSPPLHWRCSPAVAYRPDAAAMEFKEMDWNKYIRNSINKGLKKWNSKKKGHNVNAIDFIQFLGHSSIHEPFDDFLTAQSIKWRPKAGRDLDTMHFINGQGLVMTFEFDTAAVEEGTKIKSEGDYIFNHFTVQFIAEDKKHGKYVGQMLHDLALNDTRAAVERKLGAAPTRRLDWGDNYFLDGLVWTISFTSDAIEYVMLELPRDGLRKHGLCP